MATKKTTTKKKKTAKKAAGKRKKRDEIEDPPIIVGGGGSEIIKIRGDLAITSMPPAGGYTRLRIAGVNIRRVVVDGKEHSVNPTTNNIVFTE